MERAYGAFIAVADLKKGVSDEAILAIARDAALASA